MLGTIAKLKKLSYYSRVMRETPFTCSKRPIYAKLASASTLEARFSFRMHSLGSHTLPNDVRYDMIPKVYHINHVSCVKLLYHALKGRYTQNWPLRAR